MDRRARRRKHAPATTPTKEEKREMDKVAKYMKKTLKTKQVTVKGENLEVFTGSKAVDGLMESEWGGASRRSASGEAELAFPSRVSAANYCQRLLENGYFLRGFRVEVTSSKDKKGPDQGDGDSKSSAAQRRKGKKEVSGDGSGAEKEKKQQPEKADKSEKSSEKKTKKKFKIGFHEREDQFFEDSSSEIFIWQYNPSSWRSTLIGLALLTLVISLTMYPLWPDWSRVGAYYVCLGLAALLGLLLLAELLRIVIFAGIWLTTWGRVHFMILPNLYEDVGFWDSFRPAFSLEYMGKDLDDDDNDDDDNENDERAEKRERSVDTGSDTDRPDDDESACRTAATLEADSADGSHSNETTTNEDGDGVS